MSHPEHPGRVSASTEASGRTDTGPAGWAGASWLFGLWTSLSPRPAGLGQAVGARIHAVPAPCPGSQPQPGGSLALSEGQWPGREGSFISVGLCGHLDTQGRSLFSYLWGKTQGQAPSLTHAHTPGPRRPPGRLCYQPGGRGGCLVCTVSWAGLRRGRGVPERAWLGAGKEHVRHRALGSIGVHRRLGPRGQSQGGRGEPLGWGGGGCQQAPGSMRSQ